MDMERRFVPIAEDLEVRENGDGPKGIAGTAAVFNSSTIIAGMFEERIEPGAFDDALDGDVRGLFNHDKNFILGRTPKTMRLATDKNALRYEIREMPESRADVMEAIVRGDVTGNSFSFSMNDSDDEEWIDRSKDGQLPLRIIKRVAELHDVGPVTFPAYESTSVSARSKEKAGIVCPGCLMRDAELREIKLELETARMFRQPNRR